MSKTGRLACYVCSSDDSRLFYVGRDKALYSAAHFPIFRCEECGLVYLNPQPTREEHQQFYTHEYPFRIGHHAGGAGLYAPVLGHLRQREPGTLLDIGTGNSMFLPAMKEIGWDVKGTEIDSEIVETFRDEHGIELGYGELEDIGYDDESFDAVTILGVLEHIRQPQAFMDEVTRILKPGGVLCLYIFNRGAEASLLGRYWGGFDVPRHLFSYSTRSLTRLLERSGLRVTGGHHQPISFLPFFLVWLAMRTRNRIGRSASATFPTSLPRPLRLLNTPVGRIMASMKHSSSLYVFARKPGAVPQPAGAGPA